MDHLIRAPQQRLRDRQAQGLGGLEVDDQLEFRGLLNRQVRWLGALQDLVHVGGGTARQVGQIWPIGDEAASVGYIAGRWCLMAKSASRRMCRELNKKVF